MALKTRNKGSNGTYLKIFGGKIVEERQENFTSDNEVKVRENKLGNKVYYVEYDSVSGKLVNAEMRHVEQINADVLELTIKDGIDNYLLSLNVDSRYGKSFMARMLGIDLDKPIEILPYDFENKEGKKISGLNIYQDGQKINSLYTKENPNGLPEAKQVRKGKEIKWDFTDQVNFYYDKFEEFAAKFPDKPATEAHEEVSVFAEEIEDDELPF
jgi:hypothetical protein